MSAWRQELAYVVTIGSLTGGVVLYWGGMAIAIVGAYLALALPLACVVGKRLSESSQAVALPPSELLPDSTPTRRAAPRLPAAIGADVGATGMSHRAGVDAGPGSHRGRA